MIKDARAVFETIVNRLTQKPELVERSKSLFKFFHQHESQYGELTQIVKLEKRMRDLFPQDPQLQLFVERFSSPTFDPTQIQPIISPITQTRPKMPVIMTVEEPFPPALPQNIPQKQPSPVPNSPRMPSALLGVTNSPKRPFEDIDNELNQPRKLARGESPLKGAAGRRLDAARARNLARPAEGGSHMAAGPPAPLPHGINFFLSVLPSTQRWDGPRLDPNLVIQGLHMWNPTPNGAAPVPVNHPVPTPPVPASGAMPGHWGAPPAQYQGGYYGR
jgi:cleavage stimulation factor subunit 3